MKMKCLLLAGFLMMSAFPQTGNAYTLRPADIVNETPDWNVCPDSFSIFIFDAPDLRDRSNPTCHHVSSGQCFGRSGRL